jgi:hypothetical protein
VVRIRASLVAVLFLGAAIFAGPAHDLVPAEDHAPESACTDGLPVEHFDDCGHEDAGHCHLCLHTATGSALDAPPVVLTLPALARAEDPAEARPAASDLSSLPQSRAPPAFAA